MLAQSKLTAGASSAMRGSMVAPVPARAGARSSSRSARLAVQARSTVTMADVVAINRKLEARAKALIALEEQEASLRPKVKFSLQRKVGLGEAWKLVGDVPELGRMIPEVAPYMKWNTGDVWTFEAPLRVGSIKYKAVLKRADGAYVWETGADRLLVVDPLLGPDEEVDVKLEDIRLPGQ